MTTAGTCSGLFQEDQIDRRPEPGAIDWTKIGPRGRARRVRVRELIAAGCLQAAEEFYRAATIFQRGDDPGDLRPAPELALRAVDLPPGRRQA